MRSFKPRKSDALLAAAAVDMAMETESSYDHNNDYLSSYPFEQRSSVQTVFSLGTTTDIHKTRTNEVHPGRRRPSGETQSQRSTRASSNASASTYHYPTYSLYPAPTKPLPPLPPKANGSSTSIGRPPSQQSAASSGRSSRYSERSASFSAGLGGSFTWTSPASTQYTGVSDSRHSDLSSQLASLEVNFKSLVVSDEKRIKNSVHYLDVSPTSCTLASKHGNHHIKLWNLQDGALLSCIKFSSYTEARSRGRDYLIRSHAILSETSKLLAVACKFGSCIQIWDWERKKALQTIEGADRWAAGKMEVYDHGWGRFATYRGEAGAIDLYAATRDKKPLVRMRTIKLAEANLPFVPQYPELALSATSPLLVAAAGPRPPRRGHPPPEKETLLVAWETHDKGIVGSKPYRVARPWQHQELETAIPCDLSTYGSSVVSIWIPATFRAVLTPASRGGGEGYNLTPVKVSSRFVLVWDLAANSTRTFGIPNCTSCISPDCRYVAYCHASGAGSRGTLAVIDVMSTLEVWCWPDRNATEMDSGRKPQCDQFEDLMKITELCFSADSKSLVIGDCDGRMGVYHIQSKKADQDAHAM
ncbi:hypothetical protein E4U22_006827 [Claviceps purpurea]|uniref:Uncharacterized protein n=1 Tax=Claviceps purpurea (strain 20.1) TaxID=1111077 RepID=M1WGR9_CLAP2|nr:hypothetical protein E4U12_003329 [Claviceps purpurea]CCE34798.1 uncharacterized protein CPUR_08736 [Claviceps purpurea 20.1]KAG6133579.1 hypothetical protein E4U28_006117 [Claviceps purpurea]KAG6140786.1 hypothetical protein E4U38_007106 [Claviceps purpurea]KAG6178665.1 hypothetical protein E4U36_006251 [Claviceps purpurea]